MLWGRADSTSSSTAGANGRASCRAVVWMRQMNMLCCEQVSTVFSTWVTLLSSQVWSVHPSRAEAGRAAV